MGVMPESDACRVLAGALAGNQHSRWAQKRYGLVPMMLRERTFKRVGQGCELLFGGAHVGAGPQAGGIGQVADPEAP